MRVLVVTAPYQGHFFPLVPLAWALRAAGHDIRVATPPGFAATAAAGGLPVVPVGRDLPAADPAAALRSWQDGGAPRAMHSADWFAGLADRVLDDLVLVGRSWRPHLVLHDPLSFAAPVAAAALDVPAVRHLWGVDVTWRLVAEAADRTAAAALRVGAGPPAAPALILDPCPPSLQRADVPAGLRVRYVPYNGAAPAPASLLRRGPRRRVCLTFGTVVGDVTRLTLLHRVVGALSGLDLDLIVAVDRGQRHLLASLPGAPLVIESVPLNVVLPSCDLVVHHGGAGTSMTAAAHGLPQLVLPHFADNFAHADQLAAYGAARRVDTDAAGRTIRAAAGVLLGDDRYRRRARSLQREMSAQPPPSAVVHSLEALMAANHRVGAAAR